MASRLAAIHDEFASRSCRGLWAIGFALIFLLSGAHACLAEPASFFRVPMYAVGSSRGAISSFGLGDMNDDGRPDVVSQGTYDFTASLNNGDGTFTDPGYNPYVCCAYGTPDVMAFGDLDRDGKMDVVTASNSTTDGVSCYFGDGTGLFSRITHPFTYGYTRTTRVSLALGDFNHDAFLDIAYADTTLNSVQVLLNAGDGTFPHQLSFAVAEPIGLVSLDLDGDGDLDLVTASAVRRALVVLAGFGDGDFETRVSATTFAQVPIELSAADVNVDGHTDFAVVSMSAGVASAWWVATSPGGLFAAPSPINVPSGFQSSRLLDVDGDGYPDLVGIARDAQGLNRVALLRGDGSGSFATAVLSGLGVGPGQIEVSDLDGDGRRDVLSASPLALSELLNIDGTRFGVDVEVPLGVASDDFRAVDLDADGWADLVVDPGTSPGLVLYPGAASGAFGAALTLAWPEDWSLVAVTDLNRDQKPDLVVSRYTSNGRVFGIALNLGHLSFGTPVTTSLGDFSTIVGMGDVDGDGVPDLVAFAYGRYYNDPIRIATYRGAGNGTVLAPVTTARAETNLAALRLADTNLDGRADLLMFQGSTTQMIVSFGRTDGGFEGSVLSKMPGSIWQADVTELDHDGKPDLVAVTRDSNSPYWSTVTPLLGNGAGAFLGDSTLLVNLGNYFNTVYLAGFDPTSLDFGDVNGDGNADVVISYRTTNSITAYLGDGRGNLTAGTPAYQYPEYRYKVPGAASRVQLLDADHDGALDALVAHGTTNSLSLLRGTACATPAFTHLKTVMNPPSLVIQWAPESPVTYSAEVYRTDNSRSWQRSGDATVDGAGIASFQDANVTPGRTYHYKLLVRTATCSGYTRDVVVCAPRTPRVDLGSLDYPQRPVVADVDRDGHPDILTLSGGHTLSVLGSAASPDWSVRRDYPLPRYTWDIVSGDFNGDGIPDVVTDNLLNYPISDSSAFGILLGQPGGSFSAPTYITSGGSPLGLAAADFNRDGKDDVAVSTGPGTVAIYLSAGDATFERRRLLFTTGDVREIGVGDFNEDGTPDLVMVSFINAGNGTGTGNAAVALGAGDGTFTVMSNVVTPTSSELFTGILTRDIDGDHHCDLAIGDLGSYQYNSQMVIWRGDGAGHLASPTLVPSARQFRNPAVLDFNQDGVLDLVGMQHAAFGDSSRIVICPGQGGLAFGPPISLAVTGYAPFRLADIDADGQLDIVAASGEGNAISLYRHLFDVTTPVLASLESFEVDGAGVLLYWWLPPGTEVGAHVVREESEHGSQTSVDLGTVTEEGRDRVSYFDRAVRPGSRYEYRLRSAATGEWLTAATLVAVPAASLRFMGTHPNPASMRSLRFSVELASREPARLELIDIAGRRVADVGITEPAPGPRMVDASRAVRVPGVYWGRLRQGTRVSTGRVVVMP